MIESLNKIGINDRNVFLWALVMIYLQSYKGKKVLVISYE